MSWRRIRAIAGKDAAGARRDARILVLLLLPLVLALALRGGDDSARSDVHVVIAGPAPAGLTPALEAEAADAAALKVTRAGRTAAAGQVRSGDADAALLLPPGFPAALSAGAHPRITLVPPDAASGSPRPPARGWTRRFDG
jgi:hypothetical protein